MDGEVLIPLGVLLALIVYVSIIYSRRLQKAQSEYEKAKTSVEDVILSFNRQLKHESEKLDLVGYKIEALTSKSENAITKATEAEKGFGTLQENFKPLLDERPNLVTRLEDVEKKLRDATASQEALSQRITKVEGQAQQYQPPLEFGAEPVIPIRRERALAPLTETELTVLEMLASEGPKTAPKMKENIKLSREHTARLMKKLYEGGYLERETGKIPFKYSVKKEMEKLLKKPEGAAA
jgi:hypothetical protein